MSLEQAKVVRKQNWLIDARRADKSVLSITEHISSDVQLCIILRVKKEVGGFTQQHTYYVDTLKVNLL